MNKVWFAAAFSLVSAAVSAAGDRMKPGNYEYTIKMEMPGMPIAMPAQTITHCVTQADVDQGNQYKSNDPQRGDCEVKNMKQSGGKATFDMACKDGTTGNAEYTFTGDSMTGKTVMHHQGHDMNMNMSAKRTGDCTK